MRSTCRGGSEDHVCWGSVGLAAGWGGSRRAARAPRPRVRSGNKIILYASALRGPSRARPRRALHTAYAARGLSRDPAAFISLQSSALAVTGAGWSLRFTNNGIIHNPLNCFVTLIINKRLGITCTRTRACVLRRPRRARGYIIATVGRSGSFHRALLHLGKHEADDHLAAVLGAEDLECVVGLAVAWLEPRRTRQPVHARGSSSDRSNPLSRGHFLDFTRSLRYRELAGASGHIGNVETERSYRGAGRARGGLERRARAAEIVEVRHARPRRDGAGTRSTRTDKYSILRYLSAVLGRFHLCFALCSRYSLGRGGQIMLAQPPQTPHQASRVASRCARAGTQTMATPRHRITTLHSLQHARPPARPCNGILSS